MRRAINLTPDQVVVLGLVVAVVLGALLVGVALEALVGRGAGWVLRRLGVAPPRRSSARVAIDELEARVRGEDGGER